MVSQMPTRAELKKNLRALEKHLSDRPMDLDARMRLARTFRLLARIDDAVAHYASVARYLSLSGHPLQAIAVLKELLQVDPDHQETLLFLAKLYARTRSSEEGAHRGRIAVPIRAGDDKDSQGRLQDAAEIEDGLPREPNADALQQKIPVPSAADRDDSEASNAWRSISPSEKRAALAVPSMEGFAFDDPSEDFDAKSPSASQEEPATTRDLKQRGRRGVTTLESDPPFVDVSFDDDYEVVSNNATGDVLLPRVPLFSSLSPEAFVQLSHAMIFLKARAGDVLFEEGQVGDSCIIISRGRARVTRKIKNDSGAIEDVELLQLSEGDLAGIFALMSAQTRQASVTAITDLEYFEIDRLAVDDLVQKHPSVRATLAQFFRERLLLSVLASLPFFQSLSVAERRTLATRFQDRRHQPGDQLFATPADGDGLWVVLEGRVAVGAVGDAGFEKKLELGPGDYVGSLARLDVAKADLGAVALSPMIAAVLPHKAFSDLLSSYKDLSAVRERFARAGVLVGNHVFAGNGTLSGHLVGVR